MTRIILQGIIQCPRLMWQIYFQPSKVDYLVEMEDGGYIILVATTIFGLILGTLLSGWDYFLHNDLLQCISIICTFALIGIQAGSYIFPKERSVTYASAVLGIIFSIIISKFIFPDGFGGLIAMTGSLGAMCVLTEIVSIIRRKTITIFYLLAGLFSTCLCIGGLYRTATTSIDCFQYQIAVFTVSFLFVYQIGSHLVFKCYATRTKQRWYLRGVENGKSTSQSHVSYHVFCMIQKYSMIILSMSFLVLLVGLLNFEKEVVNFFDNINKLEGNEMEFKFLKPIFAKHYQYLTTNTAAVMIIPIFVLHIPEYLLCIPVWIFQLRNASKNHTEKEYLIRIYRNAPFFRHEMLFIQFLGLHKLILYISRNKELGMKEAVKRLDHLYWFTFQQKEAQKAIVQLGRNMETVHQYIHYLLEKDNLPLLKILARDNRLARLYVDMFEKAGVKEKFSHTFSSSLLTTVRFLFFGKQHGPKLIGVSETAEGKIKLVLGEIRKETSLRFHSEMIATFETAHGFLTAQGLADIYKTVPILVRIENFPQEIKYFIHIRNIRVRLDSIAINLRKIETIERFETRRSLLSEQKREIKALSKSVESEFYQPFAYIWKSALDHVAEVVQNEIDIQQESATLGIALKNPAIMASPEEQRFYFEVGNTGQEFAQDVSVKIDSDNPAVRLCGETTAATQVIEAGENKTFVFSVIADTPAQTTIRGTATFSDRTRKAKTLPFSFPVTVTKEKTEFREIANPYFVGNPLGTGSPVYFGREDAYDFIDKSILSGEGDAHHTIVCHGLRRTGKSSLLYRIAELGFTDPRLAPVLFDMQGVDDETDFFASLADAVAEKLSPDFRHEVRGFGDFKRFLKQIDSGASGKIAVILMDEFEELQMRVEDKRMARTVFSNIRHLMQHERKLVFLFCGTHKLEEMSADYWSIFFNTALYLKINYLSREDTERLVREPVKGQLDWDGLAVEQVCKMTHGQPYLTQLVCRTVVNRLNEQKRRNHALIDDVDSAVEKIITQGDDHFSAYIWKEASLAERVVLSAAADEITKKQLDHVGLNALHDRIRTAAPKFTRKACVETLSQLAARDIIGQTETRYAFPVNLFRKWVFARHPLTQVREEME